MFFLQDTSIGKSFAVSTGLVSISSSSETSFLYFKNPDGGSEQAMIVNIVVGSTSVDNLKTTFRVYEMPAISANGTQLTATNMRIDHANTPQCLIYKQPTISNLGTLKFVRAISLGASSEGIGQVVILEPGKSILVTVQNSSVLGVNLHMDINWLEGSF